MRITCWGSRGSIPVSGKEYQKYGGDTTCLEIRTKDDDIIIIDAGTGVRRLGRKLIEEKQYKYHFIFTHAHWDHILGFPFFKPLYHENAELLIYRCPFTDDSVEKMISKVISPPNFPLSFTDISASITYKEGCPDAFDIGPVHVVPIELSHPNGGRGYKFIEDEKSFVFLTDNELGTLHPGGRPAKDYLEFIRDADLVFHDTEYTPEEYEKFIGFGHSTYKEVVEMAMGAGVKKLGLFHLNQDRTDKEVDHMVRASKKIVAQNKGKLNCFAVAADMSFKL